MPFVKITRDKRGYEHLYLMHAAARRGKPARQRVLYWFRTPPGVKVGREPFDEGVRRALEAQYPELAFDWVALANTPPPPPDVEHWREKRRAEKAVKAARRAEALAEAEVVPDEEPPGPTAALDGVGPADQPTSPVEAAETAGGPVPPTPGHRRRRRGGRHRRRGAAASSTPDQGSSGG